MFKKNIRQLKSESGVTLVELLAAITILSLFVTAFLAYFTQAANTNSITNEVNEATFIAQEEMEYITSLSTQEYSASQMMEDYFEGAKSHTVSKGDYKVTRRLLESSDDSSLYGIIVTVLEGGKLRAKMETRLPFAEESPE